MSTGLTPDLQPLSLSAAGRRRGGAGVARAVVRWCGCWAALILACAFPATNLAAEGGVEVASASEAPSEKPDLEVARVDRSPTKTRDLAIATRRVTPPLILLANQSHPTPRTTVTVRRFTGVTISAIPLPEETTYWETKVDSHSASLAVRSRDYYEPTFLSELADGADDPDEGWPPSRGFSHHQLLAGPQTPINPPVVALQRLSRKIGFRHLRRYFRSELRDQFEADPSFTYHQYELERQNISALGRGSRTSDAYDLEATLQEVRNGVLENDPNDAERELVIVDWGPFRIDDRGNLRIDMKRLKDAPETAPELELAPDELKTEPLFGGRRFRVKTDARFRPDVKALIDGEDYREIVGKTGVSLDIDFYTPVLQRKYMKAEFEATLDTDGETALFVNFILYAK